MSNPERSQDFRQGPSLRFLNRCNQFGGADRGKPFQPGHLFNGQRVDIRRVAHQAGFGELQDRSLTQTLDIHRPARTPVDDSLVTLKRTGRLDTASIRLTVRSNQRTFQRTGTDHRERPGRQADRTQRQHRPDDLGDHVASLAHNHRVAWPHVFHGDLVLIVQRRHSYRRATNKHRFQHRERCGPPGTSNRNLDATQQRGALLWRELVCDCPPRGPRRKPQPLPLNKIVDLDHDPVDLVAEVVAMFLAIGAIRDDSVDRTEQADVRVDREPQRANQLQRLVMRTKSRPTDDLTNLIRPKRQTPTSRCSRIFLPKTAGGSIARIHERPRSRSQILVVELLEHSVRHVHLTANLQHIRCRTREYVGNIGNRAHIASDVLTDFAVPTSRRLNETAMFVPQTHRQAVELQLGDKPGHHAIETTDNPIRPST